MGCCGTFWYILCNVWIHSDLIHSGILQNCWNALISTHHPETAVGTELVCCLFQVCIKALSPWSTTAHQEWYSQCVSQCSTCHNELERLSVIRLMIIISSDPCQASPSLTYKDLFTQSNKPVSANLQTPAPAYAAAAQVTSHAHTHTHIRLH